MQIARAHVEKRVWPTGFTWRVCKGFFNRHDKTIFVMEKVAYSAEFARYGLLGHDAVYCGTDLPTFRWNLIASFSLVGIYRTLWTSSVSCIRWHEDGDSTVQWWGENLGIKLERRVTIFCYPLCRSDQLYSSGSPSSASHLQRQTTYWVFPSRLPVLSSVTMAYYYQATRCHSSEDGKIEKPFLCYMDDYHSCYLHG